MSNRVQAHFPKVYFVSRVFYISRTCWSKKPLFSWKSCVVQVHMVDVRGILTVYSTGGLVDVKHLICLCSSVFFQAHNRDLPLKCLSGRWNMAIVVGATNKQIRAVSAVVLVNERAREAEIQCLLIDPVHAVFLHIVWSNHHSAGVVSECKIVGVAHCYAVYLIESQINIACWGEYHALVANSVLSFAALSMRQLKGIVDVSAIISSDHKNYRILLPDTTIEDLSVNSYVRCVRRDSHGCYGIHTCRRVVASPLNPIRTDVNTHDESSKTARYFASSTWKYTLECFWGDQWVVVPIVTLVFRINQLGQVLIWEASLPSSEVRQHRRRKEDQNSSK